VVARGVGSRGARLLWPYGTRGDGLGAFGGCGVVLRGQRLYAVAAGPGAAAGKKCADGKRRGEYAQAEGKDGFKVSVALMSAPLQHPWNWALSLVALATKAASLLAPIIVG